MNNLHRELAPISDAAWSQIEEETTRTLSGIWPDDGLWISSPGGIALPGVSDRPPAVDPAPAEGIVANQREVKPLVELRVPFELPARRSTTWSADRTTPIGSPRKTRRRNLPLLKTGPSSTDTLRPVSRAFGRAPAIQSTTLPADVRDYPDAVAHALSQLRLVGVNGPYSVLLGADEYTALAETRDHGYPVLEHVKRIVDGNIVWAPAIEGAVVLTTRGGDFELNIGQDVSIGYLSHTDSAVRLYLQETFVFRVLTSEASVVLSPSQKSS